MIQLTRINHLPMVLNSDLIEHIESSPDTIISLINGKKLVVLESVDDVVEKVIKFRRTIYCPISAATLCTTESAETQSNG